MTSHRFLPYARQSIDAADIQEVSQALSSEIVTRGPRVEAFERAIAEYCGAHYAVAFNSGTTALIAACHAARLGPGDRVISTPNTFMGTVTAAMQHQAMPIFVDIDPTTGNFNLDQVESTLQQQRSSRGRTIIMPVHFGGIPVDMKRLDGMICSPDTVVIEDAAHALGSCYADGQKVGCCAWSQMTIFSFHPAKTITTGEGGMVLTNDPNLYDRLLLFRNNGIVRDRNRFEADKNVWYDGYYEAVEMAGNYNFTEFQAALGLSQFKKIDQFIEKRRQLIDTYHRLLNDFSGVNLLTLPRDIATAFHLCVVQVDFDAYHTNRATVMTQLKERGVGTQLHYIPVYHHPFFKNQNGAIDQYFPNMEAYYSKALSLPLYYDLQTADVEYVVATLKEVLATEQKKKPLLKEKNAPHHHGKAPMRYRHHRH